MCIKNCSAMKISINAPSYKRPSKVLTLDYLPMCRIWVDCKEYDEYKKHYPKADIVSCPEGVQGNVGRIRNYILRQEFERGMDAVVIVDDDLTAIERFVCRNGYGYERERVQAEDFMDFVERYSIMAQDIGAKLWGVNITPDTMAYRYTSPFSTRAIILGPFGCFLKGNRCWYDEKLPLKEDYDMCIQQLNKERVVFRVYVYHYICKQSENAGGCATYRNMQREREQLARLRKKWGSAIVNVDETNKVSTSKRKQFDYNPIITIPIKGI